LKRICTSMFIAAALCDGIVHNRSEALDVLTHEQNLVNIAIILREALCILESCLFMAENIRSIQQRKRPGMKRLKAILAPTDVREDVKSGLTRFVGGSREWLHGEVLRWLDDRNGRRFLWLRMAAGWVPLRFVTALATSLMIIFAYMYLVCRNGENCVLCLGGSASAWLGQQTARSADILSTEPKHVRTPVRDSQSRLPNS
jgi:hypothetical protein